MATGTKSCYCGGVHTYDKGWWQSEFSSVKCSRMRGGGLYGGGGGGWPQKRIEAPPKPE